MYIFKYMGPRATIIDENFRVTTKIKIMKNQVPEALFFVKKRFQNNVINCIGQDRNFNPTTSL